MRSLNYGFCCFGAFLWFYCWVPFLCGVYLLCFCLWKKSTCRCVLFHAVSVVSVVSFILNPSFAFLFYWCGVYLLCFCPLTSVCSTLHPYSFPRSPVVNLISFVLAIAHSVFLTDLFVDLIRIWSGKHPLSYRSEVVGLFVFHLYFHFLVEVSQPVWFMHAYFF